MCNLQLIKEVFANNRGLAILDDPVEIKRLVRISPVYVLANSQLVLVCLKFHLHHLSLVLFYDFTYVLPITVLVTTLLLAGVAQLIQRNFRLTNHAFVFEGEDYPKVLVEFVAFSNVVGVNALLGESVCVLVRVDETCVE